MLTFLLPYHDLAVQINWNTTSTAQKKTDGKIIALLNSKMSLVNKMQYWIDDITPKLQSSSMVHQSMY